MHKKVFIIDDEADMIELYQVYFFNAGFKVDYVRTGQEALNKIKKIAEGTIEMPDLIILDLLLTDISGLSILGEIRKEAVFNNTLVIIMTNYVSPMLEKEIKAMPNTDYLSKFDVLPPQLIKIVEQKLV